MPSDDEYKRLMERVREMENVFHDKLNAELSVMTREMEHRLSDEKRALREQHEASIENAKNMANESATRMEIATLQDKVEQYQGKYFDVEQTKIELTDQLEELQRDMYQMEDKMEPLEIKNKKLQKELKMATDRMREEQMRSESVRGSLTTYTAGGGHNRRSTEEWSAMVQKLREDKDTQEEQYEAEMKEFRVMVDQKMVCDTVFVNVRQFRLVTRQCLCR